MKRYIYLFIVSSLILFSKQTGFSQFTDEESVYENNTLCYSFGVFGNSGLGPGVPLFIGIEKWYPFSSNIAGGIAQDLAYVQRFKDNTFYILSTSKVNLHFQPFSRFDLYGGAAFNYLLINSGNGLEYVDDFLGFQIGLRYFIDNVGLFIESGKGNYIHAGFSFSF